MSACTLAWIAAGRGGEEVLQSPQTQQRNTGLLIVLSLALQHRGTATQTRGRARTGFTEGGGSGLGNELQTVLELLRGKVVYMIAWYTRKSYTSSFSPDLVMRCEHSRGDCKSKSCTPRRTAPGTTTSTNCSFSLHGDRITLG